MRTKTLLLTAALTAAGAATSLAQVYSQNIVGYINVTNYPGYNLIANQLNATGGNAVTNLLLTPPEGTFVYKFNPATGGYTQIDFADGVWEGGSPSDLAITANPGEGVYVKNPTANPYVVTLLGEVQLTSSIAIPPGYSIVSSVIPAEGKLNDAPPAGLGFPVQEGDFVYQFNRTTGAYFQNDFADGAWEGDGPPPNTTPIIKVGEAFFVKAGAGHPAWARTFTVGP
jgi:hypothetical protein